MLIHSETRCIIQLCGILRPENCGFKAARHNLCDQTNHMLNIPYDIVFLFVFDSSSMKYVNISTNVGSV